MIKLITITNHLNESIEFDLRNPEKSGFLIQNIEGLGPVKADIHSTEIATGDGSFFNSARTNTRNIVFSLFFLSDSSIEDIRQISYKYFPIKKPLKILIETDNRTCETYGYVESNEPNIFSSMEGTQISIICLDPYFYSINKTITVFYSIDFLFEFPFSNESLASKSIELGRELTNYIQTINYFGDTETGVHIFIHLIGEATNITVSNLEAHETMEINTNKIPGSKFIAGDEIIISTIKGNKTINLLRNGTYTSILNCLSKDSDWIQLRRGSNTFEYDADTGINNLQVRMESSVVFEGV